MLTGSLRVLRVLAALFVAMLWSSAAFAEELKVLILPFDVYGAKNISAERRAVMDALASGLEGAGAEVVGIEEVRELVEKKGVSSFTDEDAIGLSMRVRADFAVLGAVTRLGEAIEANWRVVDLKEKVAVAYYYKSSSSVTELLEKVGGSSAGMREKMTSVLMSRPVVKSGVLDRIVITGNRRVDTEAVRKKMTSRAGEPYSPDDVKDDVRAIYGTGFFDDVAVDLSDTASGKVLTFILREMPFIRKVEFKGNSEIKDDRIKTAITLKENTVLDRVVLADNADKIKRLYSEEGYYLTTVKPVISSDGVDASISFDIEEGPQVKVKRITFIGNRHFSDRELKKAMSTDEAGYFTAITNSGKFNELVFQNDLAIIVGKYLDNGFINADIVDYRVLLSEDKKWFYITIALNEGEQFRIGKIDLAGDELPDLSREELLSKIKLSAGEIFNRSKLSKGIEGISAAYGDKGYAYADVKPATKVNPALKIVDLTVNVKKNELVYIERIDITGNVRTRDKVVRRELELGEGDLFSSSALKRSRGNLRRLGYFEDVRISQIQGSTNERMNLNVDVKERPTGSFSMGIGYSSVDKFIGTASISQSNLMGTGIRLDISGTVSSSSSKYVLGLTEPWLFDKPISAGFDIYDTVKDYPDFKLSKKGFDLRFGFPITDRYTRGYVTYKLEDVNITDVAAAASSFIREQEGQSTESSLRLNVRRDTRDDAFFPSEGTVLSFSTELAGGPLGGTSQFIKYEAEAARYFPLAYDTTFSLHGSAGYVQQYGDKTIPIFEKYFLGGMNSIRGFKTRSVGPKDPETGEAIGGNKMMYVNAEFLFPISEQSVRGVVFFDAGNAYLGEVDLGDVRKGAGAGIRWFSPIGPLRIELGFNLDRKEGERASQWDFTIGSAF